MDLAKTVHLCRSPWGVMPERPRRSACCARALHRDEGRTGDDAAFMEELASLRTRLQKPDKSKRRMLEITWQVRSGAAKVRPFVRSMHEGDHIRAFKHTCIVGGCNL